MLELSITVSIIILAIYIKKANLKPSKDYIGDESGLINRAQDVIYYNTLNNITTYFFPLLLAFTYFTEFMYAIEKLYNSWLRFILFSIGIVLLTIIVSKAITIIMVKRAIKKKNLKRYIGGMWYKTIE